MVNLKKLCHVTLHENRMQRVRPYLLQNAKSPDRSRFIHGRKLIQNWNSSLFLRNIFALPLIKRRPVTGGAEAVYTW